jgi:hypothetical protein
MRRWRRQARGTIDAEAPPISAARYSEDSDDSEGLMTLETPSETHALALAFIKGEGLSDHRLRFTRSQRWRQALSSASLRRSRA